jgi:hypothetical protein
MHDFKRDAGDRYYFQRILDNERLDAQISDVPIADFRLPISDFPTDP